MSRKLLLQGLWNALGEAVYISLVAILMQNANHIFGEMPGVIGTLSFLLLFVVSAAVSGALVLGKPILLYLEGKKGEAVRLFLATLGWMVVILLVIILILVIK